VLGSSAFLLALVLFGIVVAAIGSDQPPIREPRRTPSGARRHASAAVPEPSGAAASSGAVSGCDLPAGEQRVPSGGPPPARWGVVGSMQVPQNPEVFGPQRSSGRWNTCFAHDPAGALLAAMNLWAEGTAAAPGEVFARLAVGAPKELGNDARLDSGGPVQFAGYRYDSYTPAEAEVAVVLRGSEGKLLAVVTPMVWRAGDWKYLFPVNGATAMQVIGDMSGYVPWSSF
jgi:hypothetical protein